MITTVDDVIDIIVMLFYFVLACFCSKKTQEVPCRANVADTYSCDNICNKPLDCEKHYCQKVCHPESCETCSLTPERVTMCCCNQTPLTEKRESCMDPVPTCDKICSKRLKCGQPSKRLKDIELRALSPYRRAKSNFHSLTQVIRTSARHRVTWGNVRNAT